MTSFVKKEEEKIIIELFRRAYKEFPKGRLAKSESPDFILKLSPKKSIGIELTKLYNHNDIQIDYSVNALDSLIKKKEEKIRLYLKKKTNELWLIITIESISVNAWNKLSGKIEKWNSATLFHKVFVFELFDKKIIEL